jgi:DNA repair protein RecO (recombination protein O)
LRIRIVTASAIVAGIEKNFLIRNQHSAFRICFSPMSAEKTIAIVLRVVEFSETSSVVTLFSREFGKLRGLAKGARRLKGPFESALDLLALCRIVFLRKSSDALELLTEAKLERRFRPAKGDLAALYAAYYIAELLNELTLDHDPHPDLFDAAERSLAALSEPAPVAIVVLRFELTALQLLGHLPQWNQCVECGKPVLAVGRVAFGQLAGGVLCADCRPGQKQVVAVSAAVIELLARLSDPAIDLRDQQPDPGTLGEARAVVGRYMAHLLGHVPRMHRYMTRT